MKEQGRCSFGRKSQPGVHFSATCPLCDLEQFLDFSEPSFSLVKEGNWQDAKVEASMSAGSDFGSPEFQGLKPERVQRNRVPENSRGI